MLLFSGDIKDKLPLKELKKTIALKTVKAETVKTLT